MTDAKTEIKAICKKPPRLNERILIGSYAKHYHDEMAIHAEVVKKCGLTAEIDATEGMKTKLYAARRKERKPE